MIEPGSKLAHYEVVSALGKGGMGEVWRAKDTKLGREVAIKTLPEEFAQDADRLARFEREAQLLASLNHPNIAAIYGLDEYEGTRFLVLELIEGDTLATRVRRGAIPVEESLKLSLQIVEALEAAHEKGVIHRDLKPANIKVTPQGKVKVLDFGLAKAFASDGVDTTMSNSPTLSMNATRQGVVLGTAAYMSPEQARGQEVDKRGDLWAFGCVLYEMLTGRPTWMGPTVTDLVAAAVATEPDFSILPANIHPRIRELLRRCLEKDPMDRARDAGDIRIEIRQVLTNPAGAIVRPVPEHSHKTVQSKLPWAVAVVATLAAVVFGIGLWQGVELGDRSLIRLEVDLGSNLSLGPIAPGSVIISPDGTRIAYAASVGGGPPRIYTRLLEEAQATALQGTEGANRLFFSPDGEWIGFGFGRDAISKVSVEGGAVVPIADNIPAFGGGSWGSDGTIVFSQGGVGLMTVSDDGGELENLVSLDAGELVFASPEILPGDGAVLMSTLTDFGDGGDSANIEIMSMADGVRTIVGRGASPHYLPSGHLVYISGGTLFAQAFDLETFETLGSRVAVIDDILFDLGTGAGTFSFSEDGTAVYRSRSEGRVSGTFDIPMVTVEWIDRDGNREHLMPSPGRYEGLQLSPDGSRLVLAVGGALTAGVAMYDPQREDLMMLTTANQMYQSPVWTSNQEYVVFGAFAGGLYQARVDGAGPPELIVDGANLRPASLNPDAVLGYQDGLRRIMTVAVEDDGTRLLAGRSEELLTTETDTSRPEFSPDGEWLAYVSTESGQAEVSVSPFGSPDSGEAPRFAISNGGGTYPVWSPNSQELFYRSLDGQIMVVSYQVQGDQFIADRPSVWAVDPGGEFWDIAPDGRALITVAAPTDEATDGADHHAVFLQNFFDYLRREVPVP